MSSEFQEFLITDSVHADTMNARVTTPGNNLRTEVQGKVDSTGDTLTGALNFDSNEAQNAKIVDGNIQNYVESLKTLTSTSAALTLDLAEANVFDVTVGSTHDLTLSLGSKKAGAHSFTLFLHQSTGGNVITMDFGSSAGAVLWPSDAIPDVVDGETNLFTFASLDVGANWYGHKVGDSYGDGST